jgi:hypothetical protein
MHLYAIMGTVWLQVAVPYLPAEAHAKTWNMKAEPLGLHKVTELVLPLLVRIPSHPQAE